MNIKDFIGKQHAEIKRFANPIFEEDEWWVLIDHSDGVRCLRLVVNSPDAAMRIAATINEHCERVDFVAKPR